MKKASLFICLLLECVVASSAPLNAARPAAQNHALIREAVAAFVQRQTTDLPGKITYQINEIDRRIMLSACEKPEAFLPAGNQLVGNTAIGVRCTDDKGWTILVPVQIKLTVNLLTSRQHLPSGHVLHEEDLAFQATASENPGALTDSKQVVGKVLRYNIASGQVLRADMLRAPYSVLQGQVVQLSVRGRGFSVRSEGIALNNASEGQSANVRIASGRVISGIAIEGGAIAVGIWTD
jgi:flagella basal body P-ring formation protein FlgA